MSVRRARFLYLVEEGLIEDRIVDDMVDRYLSELKEYRVDSLVLGCTHYPLLSNPIKRYMGEKVTLINPAYETAKELKNILGENNMLCTEDKMPLYKFYVSDGVDKFKAFADRVLPIHVDTVNVVDIESY